MRSQKSSIILWFHGTKSIDGDSVHAKFLETASVHENVSALRKSPPL
jgi:hypothetical protein